jgi:hypothetical protein
MLDTFRQPPPPLTRRQNQIVIATSILVAVTRFVARTRSAWDWDEFLFQLGVREYDVTQHHPHPPGYPIFIAAAKFVRLFTQSDFHALQIVVLVGALLLFPVVFFFARELRFDFRTSLFGALIASFLPNIWYYGGTAFSDIPGVVSGLLACVLILRGCRDARAYVAGAFLLGLSAGIRPQNLMTALVPALIATIIRIRVSWKSVVIGALAGAIAVAGCYAGAALASKSADEYVYIVKMQQKWVHDIDSFHNPQREPLTQVARRVFLWPCGARREFIAMFILAVISLIDSIFRRRVSPLLALLTFLPFALFTWFMLSYEAIPRYAIGYIVANALLAADGIAAIARFAVLQSVLSLVLVFELGAWTWPAIRMMHRTLSPPANAMRYIREHAKPHQSTIFVHTGLHPFSDHDLADYAPIEYQNDKELPEAGSRLPAYILTPEGGLYQGGETFSIPRNSHLWDIVRRRNFETTVLPAYRRIRFGAGWYEPEGEGFDVWRWMGAEARMTLPPLPGRGKFAIHFLVPLDLEAKPPTLEVRVNGAVIEHSLCTSEEQRREWVIPSLPDRANDVVLSVSDAPIPAALHRGTDGRALGLELRDFSWAPVP